jgi:hypothetical protein
LAPDQKEANVPKKDPRQMKTGEVAKMAKKAGIQDTGHMNKQQMLQAMARGPSRASQPAGAESRSGPKRGR